GSLRADRQHDRVHRRIVIDTDCAEPSRALPFAPPTRSPDQARISAARCWLSQRGSFPYRLYPHKSVLICASILSMILPCLATASLTNIAPQDFDDNATVAQDACPARMRPERTPSRRGRASSGEIDGESDARASGRSSIR